VFPGLVNVFALVKVLVKYIMSLKVKKQITMVGLQGKAIPMVKLLEDTKTSPLVPL